MNQNLAAARLGSDSPVRLPTPGYEYLIQSAPSRRAMHILQQNKGHEMCTFCDAITKQNYCLCFRENGMVLCSVKQIGRKVETFMQ